MTPRRRPITQHRLARMTRWMRLRLQGFALFLLLVIVRDPAMLKRALNRESRRVARLILLHVVARLSPLRPHGAHKPVRRAGLLRALIGSGVRKAVRRRDPVEHFFALLEAMRDLKLHVERLVRRLAKGTTRLRVILPVRESCNITVRRLNAEALICADTS